MNNENEIRDFLNDILNRVECDEAVIYYGYSKTHSTRFGENAITQNMGGDQENISIRLAFGARHGSASTTNLSEESINRMIERSIENAKMAEEDEEFVPCPGKQVYPEVPTTYFEDTEAMTPATIAGDVKKAVDSAKEKKYHSSGLFQSGHGRSGMANSKGLFAFNKSSHVSYSLTVHGPKGCGSESITRESYSDVDVDNLITRAIATAEAAQNPIDVEPEDMTVVFEPRAVNDLLQFMFYSNDARSADEGRSAFSGKLGEPIAAPGITLETRLDDPALPGSPTGADGLPARPMTWIEDGILKRLRYDRYWAQEKGETPDPNMGPLFMSGEDRSLEELIGQCKNGVLVKRLWYIRFVDAKELLLTGMTRDGFFRIENGKVTKPLKNLRFNESPLTFLKNVEAMSRPERVGGSKLPGIMSKEFTFSSKTDSL